MTTTAEHIKKGNVIDYTATADIAYHEVIPLTSRIGVALEKISANSSGSIAISDIWEIPAATSLAIAIGDEVYYNTSNSNIDKTDTGIPAGVAVAAKAAAGTTVQVKIG